MADSLELRMSVKSIQRVDPYMKDVLATASHVALYKFNTTTNEWEKSETEGALFIYSRNGEPYNSIMVMNRLNTNNLIEPIVKDFDYQMQVPFLLYRNSKSKIYGIWFFNREDCIRITFIINSLMEGLKDNMQEKSERKNGDIFSMLSKAQEDFNKTPTKQESMLPLFSSSTPRVPDGTSQSVMDFFAKASTKSTQKPIGSGSGSENVLQRLMSNPAHSVEHIEKQQRSITPQDQVHLKQKGPDRPISVPGPSNNGRENGISKNTTVSPLAFLMQNQSVTTTADESRDLLGSSPFAQFMDNVQKPQLMTPMMFTTPTTTTTTTKEKIDVSNNSAAIEETEEKIDLLTEKQLAQALIYLLKNNPDFTRQIHEAYVSSIMERVNNSKSFI